MSQQDLTDDARDDQGLADGRNGRGQMQRFTCSQCSVYPEAPGLDAQGYEQEADVSDSSGMTRQIGAACPGHCTEQARGDPL